MTQPHSFPVYAFTNSHSVVVTILSRVRRDGKKFKKKKIAKMSFYLVSCWKCLIAMSGVSELCTAALQRCYFCGCLCLSECPRKCLEAAVSLVRTREWEQAARSVSNIDCRGPEQSQAAPGAESSRSFTLTMAPRRTGQSCSSGPVTPYQHVGTVQCGEQ